MGPVQDAVVGSGENGVTWHNGRQFGQHSALKSLKKARNLGDITQDRQCSGMSAGKYKLTSTLDRLGLTLAHPREDKGLEVKLCLFFSRAVVF